MKSKLLYGGIEAGGTKFVCAVGDGDGNIIEKIQFPTAAPAETLKTAVLFFKPFVESGALKNIGLGSFGPIDLEINSVTYGYITTTPKPKWQNTNIVGALETELGVKVIFDTDVNAAAFGEFMFGASKDLDPSLYITIGTGIGGGYVIGSKTLKGLAVPEMGHIRVLHDWKDDDFSGVCPYHGDCFEGLASGVAIYKRTGKKAEVIDDNDAVWDLEANYIGQAIANLVLILSPKKIILGGGVMHSKFLFAGIRKKVQETLNNYVQHKDILENIDEYIIPPALGDNSGVLGAIALAKEAE